MQQPPPPYANYDRNEPPYPTGDTYSLTPTPQMGTIMPPPAPQTYGNVAYAPAPADDSPFIDGDFAAHTFNEKSVRHAFIKKVYMILSVQLFITLAMISIFQFVKPVSIWVRNNIWFYYLSYAVFLVVYIALICCRSLRRKFPGNFIALGIFTLAFSYMTGTITSFYQTSAVFYAVIITAALCIGLTIFAMQTKIDFTMCSGMLFAFLLVLMLFGITVGFVWRFDHGTGRILQVVYGSLGALLFSLFLVFDTQMIVGGRKHDLHPEEYIEGAMQLYLDVVYLFLFILQLFSSDN